MEQELNMSESLVDDVYMPPEERGESPAMPELEVHSEEGGGEPAAEQEAGTEQTLLEAIEEGLDKLDEDESKKEGKETAEDDPYAPPEGLGERANERFQKLVAMNQEKDAHIESLSGGADALREFGELLGGSTTPEGLNDFMSFTDLVNNGDYEDALGMLDRYRHVIAMQAGIDLSDVDPLAGHPDLGHAVQDNALSPEHAREMAYMRAQMAAQEQQHAAYEEQNRVASAQQDVNAMVSHWQQHDIDFDAKIPGLEMIASRLQEGLPPEAWGEAMDLVYQAINTATQAVAAQQGGRPVGRRGGAQPLRPGGGTGGKREPQTMLEAIEQGLAELD